MVFERPKRPGQNRSNSPAFQRPGSPMQKPARQGGGGRPSSRGHDEGPPGEEQPSPWLGDLQPNPAPNASFVEYLRWMRSPDYEYKDPTKVQILQMAVENGNYHHQLSQNNKRTKLIAGKENTIEVKCPWRIRVGGHRGPESILLPAFDALGVPYIPSSSLRGVARVAAIRSTMEQTGLSWAKAEKQISDQYFGNLEAKESEKKKRAGKVIFLDAYPIPESSGVQGGLAMDMANNIWSWDAAGRSLLYSPNPNPFISLKEATFLIGIKPASNCPPDEAEEILKQVKEWLIAGLAAGIGSQVNSGYGSLLKSGKDLEHQLFDVEFTLEGQLIHGHQGFTPWIWNDRRSKWQMRGQPYPEVRAVAFKSMLRYWFRAFGLGVLPPGDVQGMEAKLFGAISPQQRGWASFQMLNGKLEQREARPFRNGKDDPCGQQSGHLVICRSSEAPTEQTESLKKLFEALTWMMFHLGGIGQGARRPCYSRRSRDRAPWWRGSTLIPESDHGRWELPNTVEQFQKKFQRYLKQFYQALGLIAGQDINWRSPKSFGRVTRDRWSEAVDRSCRIIVCSGDADFSKPFALAILHSENFKVWNRRGQLDYDPHLCGQVQGGVLPSPVWICDLDDYQVATIFGAVQNPRQRYHQRLENQSQNYKQIFPL